MEVRLLYETQIVTTTQEYDHKLDTREMSHSSIRRRLRMTKMEVGGLSDTRMGLCQQME